MIVHLVVVLSVSAAAALAAEPLSRRLAPASAVRLLTATAVLTGLLTVWVLTALALGGLGEVPWLAERLGWCQPVTQISHDVPLGLAALAALALMALAVRAARLVHAGVGRGVVVERQTAAGRERAQRDHEEEARSELHPGRIRGTR